MGSQSQRRKSRLNKTLRYEKMAAFPSLCVDRKRLTTTLIRCAASDISSMLKYGLRLKRMAECKTSPVLPMAAKTGHGNSEPLEHAEPVEQAIPTKSKFIKSASAWQPGNERLI